MQLTQPTLQQAVWDHAHSEERQREGENPRTLLENIFLFVHEMTVVCPHSDSKKGKHEVGREFKTVNHKMELSWQNTDVYT